MQLNTIDENSELDSNSSRNHIKSTLKMREVIQKDQPSHKLWQKNNKEKISSHDIKDTLSRVGENLQR
jgi:hypothetical protein